VNAKGKEGRGLRPSLGLLDATAISVGAIIGAGIYVVIGIVAGMAGPGMLISMILAAVASLLIALSYAELSAWLPLEGSVYEFAYRLISPSAAFFAGWMYMMGNAFAGAAVALGFAYYFVALFPLAEPQVIAVLLCSAFAAVNFYGIRQSAQLNNVLVGAKLLILAFFILLGLEHFHLEDFQPSVPSGGGVIYGACYIFFAFAGFGRVSVMAEEIEDARRTVPKAIILSLLISTVFYLAIGAVAIGLVGAPSLAASSSPLADAMRATGSPAAVSLVSLGGLLATASVLLTSILAVSREAYAMALRRNLPDRLAKLHPVHGTPYISVWIAGMLMALLALLVDLQNLVAVGTFGTLFYYAMACVSDIRLRMQRREGLILPVAGVVFCLVLLIFLLFTSPLALSLGTIMVISGGLFYKLMSKMRS